MILLENLLTTDKHRDKKVNENLNNNYEYLSKIKEKIKQKEIDINTVLTDLKKQKYKCTEIAKNLRNNNIYTGSVAIIISVLLALGTAGIGLTNSVYTDTKDRVNKVTSVEIKKNETKLKELQETYEKMNDSEEKEVTKGAIDELNKIIDSQTKTSESIDKEIFKYGTDLKLQGWDFFGGLVVLAIISLGIIYTIVRGKNDKASYYETLIVMIDDMTNEIKAGSWEKAQKVELKMEDGIKIKDKVTIGY